MAAPRSVAARATAAAIRGETKGVAALRALEWQLRSDAWNRFVALAQRRALTWWRDRTVPPGLKARFTAVGAAYYGFGRRLHRPSSQLPYYHVTGRLEQLLMRRRPTTPRASLRGGAVTTRLLFGGGALNFMQTTGAPDMRPVTGWTRTSRSVTAAFAVGSHTRSTTSGARITVAAYHMTRQRTYHARVPVRSGPTHAALFGRFTRDAPAIQARVAVEFRRIVRTMAYDRRTGLLKSSLAHPAALTEAA